MAAHSPQKLNVIGSLLLLMAGLTIAHAQSGSSASQDARVSSPAPVFDVAAIHLHTPVPHEHSHILDTNGRFVTVNVTLKAIIQWAFNVPASRIVGGAAWLNSTRFDIEAIASNGLDMARAYDASAAALEKRRMVQSLLEDRFRLKTHTEVRELSVYGLVAAKDGPKFLDSRAKGTTINHGRNYIEISGGENSVALLAEELAETVGRVVIDKTGIKGRYDLTLKWTPEEAAPVTDSTEPSIFTAIQEQLGLKLDAEKGPVQVLVIDRVEMPREN